MLEIFFSQRIRRLKICPVVLLPALKPACSSVMIFSACGFNLTIVKQGKDTIVQDRSGKCVTEERAILNRWTEYCTELYNHKANGDLSVLDCSQTDTEDDHPILHKEVEAAVQSLKKGK